MQWRGRRESENVEDARGERSPSMGGGGGGLGLLMTIGKIFGFKGVLAFLVIGGIAWKMGLVDPSMLLGGDPSPSSSQPVEVSPEEQERFDFVKVVMADTEDVWTKEFARHGQKYELPAMKVYRNKECVGSTKGCKAGKSKKETRSRCLTVICEVDYLRP